MLSIPGASHANICILKYFCFDFAKTENSNINTTRHSMQAVKQEGQHAEMIEQIEWKRQMHQLEKMHEQDMSDLVVEYEKRRKAQDDRFTKLRNNQQELKRTSIRTANDNLERMHREMDTLKQEIIAADKDNAKRGAQSRNEQAKLLREQRGLLQENKRLKSVMASVQQRLKGQKEKSASLKLNLKQTDKSMKDSYLRDVGQTLGNKDWRLFMERMLSLSLSDKSELLFVAVCTTQRSTK